MKNLTVATTAFLAGAFVCGIAIYAQGAAKADPVKIDSKHYKVELENDSVRVLRVSYAPGEKSVMHSHPKTLAVFLTDGTSKMTTPDGKSQEVPIKAGTVQFREAGSHLPENVGKAPFQVIVVELKK
ncbi:MAG: hypothetical protein HY821_03210 [Acidobacteria bacterium]|nr:hypothetical protein [Acidobacteriota bacterium]